MSYRPSIQCHHLTRGVSACCRHTPNIATRNHTLLPFSLLCQDNRSEYHAGDSKFEHHVEVMLMLVCGLGRSVRVVGCLLRTQPRASLTCNCVFKQVPVTWGRLLFGYIGYEAVNVAQEEERIKPDFSRIQAPSVKSRPSSMNNIVFRSTYYSGSRWCETVKETSRFVYQR